MPVSGKQKSDLNAWAEAEEDALRAFYQAFHRHGSSAWDKVAGDVGTKTAEQCEALWKQHQTFLGLPNQPQFEVAFVAMVKDYFKNHKVEPTEGEDVVSSKQQGPGSRTAKADNGEDAGSGKEEGDEDGMGEESGADDASNAAAGGRPKRATRGKPPARNVSPTGEEEAGVRRGGQGTPLRGARGMGSPASSKSRGRGAAQVLEPPDSATRKRARGGQRKLFGEEGGEGQHTTRIEMEQGVDALLQLAMHASSMDAEDARAVGPVSPGSGRRGGAAGAQADDPMLEVVEEEGDDEAGLGAVERPGKRRVRPPARLDDGIGSPTKGGVGTPSKRGRGAAGAIMSVSSPLAATRSPARNVRQTPTRGRGRGRGGRRRGVDDEETEEEMEGEADGGEAEDTGGMSHASLPSLPPVRTTVAAGSGAADSTGGAPDLPRSARRGSTLRASTPLAPPMHDMHVMADDPMAGVLAHANAALDQLVGPDGQPFAFDPQALAALGMGQAGGLVLPPMGSGMLGAMHMGPGAGPYGMPMPGMHDLMGMAGMHPLGSPTAPLPPVSARLGAGAARPLMSHRQRRRKAEVPRGPQGNALAFTGPQAATLQVAALGGLSGFGAGSATQLRGLLGADAGLGLGGMPGTSGPASSGPEASLTHFLSSHRVRRWVQCEWHYSAIDRPWFMRNELTELMSVLGLGRVGKLKRGEWSLLRGAFGRPRRFSLLFLREERIKLEAYREHVRRKYEEAGLGSEVPPELPRPLRVGQEVVARHPGTRQLHDGVILTVKGSKYRVQFHRPELLTELINDVDVMPVDPGESLPLVLNTPAVLNGRPTQAAVALAAAAGVRGRGRGGTPGRAAGGLGARGAGGLLPPGMMPVAAAAPDPEMDAALLQEVAAKSEEKEALVLKLKELNMEAEAGVHMDVGGRQSDAFQMQYTQVILQLREVNNALEAAIQKLNARTSVASAALQQSVAGVGPLQAAAAALAASNAAAAASAQQGAGGSGGGAGAPGGGSGGGAPTGSGPSGNAAGAASAAGAAAPTGLGQASAGVQLPGSGPAGQLSSEAVERMAQAVVAAAKGDATGILARALAARGVARVKGEEGAGESESTGAQGGGAGGDGPQGARAPPADNLSRVITSCLTVMCAIQKVTGGDAAAAQPPVLDAAIEGAVKALTGDGPAGADGGAGSNVALYQDIAESVRALKTQLTRA